MNRHHPNGWYPDPTRRQEWRYWDGVQWTDLVVRNHVQFADPIPRPGPGMVAHSAVNTGHAPVANPTIAPATAAAAVAPQLPVTTPSPRSNLAPAPARSSAEPAPKVSGWYPDPVTGGTRYSDGTEWTGDVRPPRRPFSAPFSMTPLQYLLPFIMTLFLFLAIMAYLETGQFGTVAASVVALFLVLLLSVWLHRGQGPSTGEVLNRLERERKEAKAKRRSANVASFFSGLVRRNQTPAVVQLDNQGAAVAQINAISDPATARALQNLNNLLYTRALTDAEYQAAKDKLLGPVHTISQTEQIEQLAQLHRAGVIGDIEFSAAKARVLGI